MSTGLALRLVATLAVVPLLACATLSRPIEPPIVSLVGIGELAPGPFEQRFRLDLRVQNPNAFEIAVAGLDFQLDLNGTRLTRAVSNEAFNVPRLGEQRVSVTATTSLLDLARQLMRGSESTGAGMRYELRGRALLSDSERWLPFEMSGELFE